LSSKHYIPAVVRREFDALSQDIRDNPQKYCKHLEGTMTEKGVLCKNCGFFEEFAY